MPIDYYLAQALFIKGKATCSKCNGTARYLMRIEIEYVAAYPTARRFAFCTPCRDRIVIIINQQAIFRLENTEILTMKPLTPEEIHLYLKNGEVIDLNK